MIVNDQRGAAHLVAIGDAVAQGLFLEQFAAFVVEIGKLGRESDADLFRLNQRQADVQSETDAILGAVAAAGIGLDAQAAALAPRS